MATGQKARKKTTASASMGRATREPSVLSFYMEDVARHPMLTKEQEQEIGARAFAGDEDAQEALVLANLRFVVSFVRKIHVDNIDPMDLITAGNMGLMHAARKYDPAHGVKFVGYARWWVKQFVQKEIDTHSAQMRTSVTQLGLNRRVRRLNETAMRTLGREYTIEELVTLTRRHEDRVREALDYCVIPRSLDEAIDSEDGGSMTLAQVIGDDEQQQDKAREKELRELVTRILDSTMTPRERRIVVDHFGLGGNRSQSLQEIGFALGITRERVRQICRKALKRIADATEYHEELKECFSGDPNHPMGTFLINSRKRPPLPPGVTKKAHREQLLLQAAAERGE